MYWKYEEDTYLYIFVFGIIVLSSIWFFRRYEEVFFIKREGFDQSQPYVYKSNTIDSIYLYYDPYFFIDNFFSNLDNIVNNSELLIII